MSDSIKHECGIALVRLRKPLEYYIQKYGTALYGLNKMYLLLQKQHNRGQDGTGLVSVKIASPPGGHYLQRERSTEPQAIREIFAKIYKPFSKLSAEELSNASFLQANLPFSGEVLLGHLRYGTHGVNSIDTCHPHLRQNNWRTRTLALAGNFNLTNVDELFDHLVELGQHPLMKADTVTIMERVGHFLDAEVQKMFESYKGEGKSNREMTELIADNLDIKNILQKAVRKFDGGYVIGGVLGHGAAFALRDPNGIRPAYYYMDDEIVVVASERPTIQTAMNVKFSQLKELPPAHALIIERNGAVKIEAISSPKPQLSCSFERIYFSRGTDREIYQERKKLGFQLAETILKAVNYDFENTVFSYIPNTAEVAFRGLVEGLEVELNKIKAHQIQSLSSNTSATEINRILAQRPRIESIAVKDVKLRTFISQDASRNELVSHVYDVNYGVVQDYKDTLVLLDDSIVRGTTLRQSILRIVSRLLPKKIIIVSSAPQIRYPDCYGIDMSKMGEFVAFQAVVGLTKERNQEHLLWEAYARCKAQETLPKEDVVNEVAGLYAHYSYEEVSAKIAKIITPPDIDPMIEVIYQTIDDLHRACPQNLGDWYFSGNYPTPGGNKVVNKAFMLFMEQKDERAY